MGIQIPSASLSSPGKLWKFPVEDFLVVARPDVYGLYILNSSARRIWDLQEVGTPFQSLVFEFASTFGIPLELAERDVIRTLADWRLGLLATQAGLRPSVLGNPPPLSGDEIFSEDYFVHGKNIRVILQTSELAEEIAPRLDRLPRAAAAPDLTFRIVEGSDGFLLYNGDRCVVSKENVPLIRTVLLQEIVQSCRGRDCLAVFHAGACGSSSRCVVFPANTQSGKTTLAAVLMKMGMTLYADDSVLLERDTLSVPVMPFPLMLREGSWNVLYSRFPKLKDQPIFLRYGQRIRFLPRAGVKQDGSCAGVGAIVFPRFERQIATEVIRLNTLEALLRLQQSGFWVAHDETSIRSFLEWLHSTPAFSINFSEVDEAASIVCNLLN
jgi:hypothetical protein